MGRDWRVGHTGRDQMYYEERHNGAWRRIEISGEMLTGRAHHVIYFDSPERWLQYPEWARHRRAEIIARITSEFPEPDYEYYGLEAGPAPISPDAAPSASAAPDTAPRTPLGRRTPDPRGKRTLMIVLLVLFVIAACMGWLVASGVASGETYYPSKMSFLRRKVPRAEEPGMYWVSIGIYATIGIGTLTLGALGVRASRNL